jgi:hypothetical protein
MRMQVSIHNSAFEANTNNEHSKPKNILHMHRGSYGPNCSSIQSWSANLIKGGACQRGLKDGSQKPGPVRCLMDTRAADDTWVGFWLSLRQQQLQVLLNSPSLQTPLLTLESLNQNKTPPTLSLLQKKHSLMLLIYTPLLVATKVTTMMMHIVDHINAKLCKWASNPKIILCHRKEENMQKYPTRGSNDSTQRHLQRLRYRLMQASIQQNLCRCVYLYKHTWIHALESNSKTLLN